MTRKDCNWGSTLLRSMSIQFSFPACIAAIRVPAETQNGVAKNRQDTRWESKWVIAGQRLSWGHICFGGNTFKHHLPDPLLWNSGKRFSSYLDPWLFLWLGYKSAKTQKVIKGNHLLVFQQKSAPPYISTKFSRLGPWLSANNTDRRTAEPFSHTLTHCHLFFLFFLLLILIVAMAVLVDSYFNGSLIFGDWTIRHQSDNQTFGNTNHSGSMHGS